MRRLVVLLSAVLAVVVIGPVHVISQPSTSGGLTALPPTNFGPNLIQNSGFETLSGGAPVGWSSGAGWVADQLVVHSGGVSYRRGAGGGTSGQTGEVEGGTDLPRARVKNDWLGSGAPRRGR